MKAIGVVLAVLSLGGMEAADVRPWIAEHQPQVLAELADLVSIPNVSSDAAGIRRNAEALRALLGRHGLAAEILETEGNPLVYGKLDVPGSTRTVLYYIHYDGQPVYPAQWKQAGPFQPVLRAGRLEDAAPEVSNWRSLRQFPEDWRLYARSASDDKAPIVAFCAALDALGGKPSHNIRVLLDGEEELNSPHLAAAVARYRDKLRADLLVVLDGPMHPSGKPTLVFGARGEVDLEMTVYGPKFALHSGHYGNWAPNPAMRLAQLLGSMQDGRGRVTVAGFYDAVKPLPASERQVLAAVPDDLPGLQKLFGIAQPDGVAGSLQEALQYPSLNIDEFRSGSHNNIIPPEAYARVDLRLVPETTARDQAAKVLAHFRGQGFHIIETEPDDAQRLQYPKLIRVRVGQAMEAFRTPLDHPESVRLTRALEQAWGEPPVRIRLMGGTVPMAPVIATLGCPAILVPIVNFDNHQHSDNENLRLGNLWRGIVTLAALL